MQPQNKRLVTVLFPSINSRIISFACMFAGTPVQNNMKELFGLMNLLDNEEYGDEDEFFEKFGGDKEAITLPQVQALQVSYPPFALLPPNFCFSQGSA